MTETDALKIFKSIRLYFKGAYDITKYGITGVNATEKEFNKLRHFLIRAKRKFNTKSFIEFIVSNVIADIDYESIVTIDQISVTTYNEWKKRNDRFTTEFKCDIIAIRDDFLIPNNLEFNDLFKVKNGHPIILKMLLGGDILPETFIAMNDIIGFYDDFDDKLDDDFIWSETKMKMVSYRTFLKFNNVKGIMKDVYTTK